jgi:glycosyltransferase involved in cell wall biosynthesis
VSRSIALLTPAYWPEVQRGTERIVHDLAADLAARGHRPRVITGHPGPSAASNEDGFEVVRNRRPPDSLLRLRRFHDHLAHVPLSFLSLRSGDDDIAHAFYATDALAAVGWAEHTGRPAVFSYMGLPSRATATWQRGRMKILERVTRDASAVIGLSRAACDALWRWWGIEARLVYPGVDLSAFASAPKRRADTPVIACAASPDDDRKRIPLLVEAFALVRRERHDARLVLMRPRDPATERLLEQPGIEFFDPQPGAVADIFAEAWISALPSRDEAFGLVVVESLATGTPVVAAAEGGPAEILDRDGIGALFEEATPEAVARALLDALELAEDPGTEEVARARAADFSAERTAIEHERLYEELLAL